MNYRSLIIIYIALLFMCVLAIRRGYKGKINFKNMPFYSILLLLLCIILNFVLLGNLLYHSRFVPGDLKGGLYGLLGGASFGGIMISIMIASALSGIAIRHFHSGSAPLPAAGAGEKTIYPTWYVMGTQSLLGVMTGATIAIIAMALIEYKSLEDMAGTLFGFAIAVSSFYLIMAGVFYFQKHSTKK